MRIINELNEQLLRRQPLPAATAYCYCLLLLFSAGSAGAQGVVVLAPPYMLGECFVACDTLEWSGELRNPAGCTGCKDAEEMTADNPPTLAQYRDWDEGYGYYYNWACVEQCADELCPAPWRIPTRRDVNALLKCTSYAELRAAWDITGYDSFGWLALHNEWCLSWTIAPKDEGNAWGFGYDVTTGYFGWWYGEKPKGLQVRCVRTI
jgi:hypothetical protein